MPRKKHPSKQQDFKNPNGEYGYVRVEYNGTEIVCTIKRRVPSQIPPGEVDTALEELVKTGIEGVTLQLSPEEIEGIFNKNKK